MLTVNTGDKHIAVETLQVHKRREALVLPVERQTHDKEDLADRGGAGERGHNLCGHYQTWSRNTQ
jgi:hypothetical protein